MMSSTEHGGPKDPMAWFVKVLAKWTKQPL